MKFITSRSEDLDKLRKYIESDISNYNAKRNIDFGALYAELRPIYCSKLILVPMSYTSFWEQEIL